MPEWRLARIPLLFLDENRSASGPQRVPDAFWCRMRAFCAWNGNFDNRGGWADGKVLERAGGNENGRWDTILGLRRAENDQKWPENWLWRLLKGIFLGWNGWTGKIGANGPKFRVFSQRRQRTSNFGRRGDQQRNSRKTRKIAKISKNRGLRLWKAILDAGNVGHGKWATKCVGKCEVENYCNGSVPPWFTHQILFRSTLMPLALISFANCNCQIPPASCGMKSTPV